MKRMLIDASHPEETRVVIVNGNRLEDFDVEVESRKQLKGNIYLAKVTRVEPSLQAAFVDYGGNRHGFLAFNEIHPDYYQIPVADREALMAEENNEPTDDNDDVTLDSDGPVETLGGDDTDEVEERRPRKVRRNYRIQEVIKRGQILLIQVVKEERGGKGAALTTYLSLAGRYCVLMPNTARGGGISRKISNSADRKRLKVIINDLGIPDGIAVIVRTAGSKRSKAEIKRDYEYLLRLWTQIRETTLESIAPCAVHEEGNLIKRSIRDLYSKEIEEVVVSGDDGYRMAKDFMKLLIPSHAKRVQPYKDEGVSLTQRYQVENQLSAIHSPEVHMRSGGYIVINPTEALVSIDVNSGKATKERNIEETAFKTNMEAAEEIARQLKLRDLAGLIVIDFIDMESSRNQTRVERQLKDAMRNDRARIQIGRISPFGLLELSRQRLRPSLLETSSEPCPHCEGTGVRRSTDSTALHILRMLEDECTRRKADELTLYVPTAVALYLLNYKRKALADVEARYETTIIVENDDTLIPPDCRIERSGDVKVLEQPKAPSIHKQSDRSSGPVDESEQSEDGGKRRKRRRGRRRKRSDNDNTEIEGDATQAETAETAEKTEAVSEDGEDTQNKRRRRGRRGGRNRGRKPEEVVPVEASDDAQDQATKTFEGTEAADVALTVVPDTASPDENAEPEAPAKPRRRRRKSTDDTAAEVQVIPITTTEPTETTATAPEVSDEAPKPEEAEVVEKKKKPARKTRRKAAPKKVADEAEIKTESEATVTTETEKPDAAPSEEAEAPKPKRRRRAKAVDGDAPKPKKEPAKPVAISAPAKPVAIAAPAKPIAISAPEPTPLLPVEKPIAPAPEASPVVKDTTEPETSTTVAEDKPEADEKPTKRGWWRR